MKKGYHKFNVMQPNYHAGLDGNDGYWLEKRMGIPHQNWSNIGHESKEAVLARLSDVKFDSIPEPPRVSDLQLPRQLTQREICDMIGWNSCH